MTKADLKEITDPYSSQGHDWMADNDNKAFEVSPDCFILHEAACSISTVWSRDELLTSEYIVERDDLTFEPTWMSPLFSPPNWIHKETKRWGYTSRIILYPIYSLKSTMHLQSIKSKVLKPSRNPSILCNVSSVFWIFFFLLSNLVQSGFCKE